MKVLVKQAQRGNADAFISLIEENRQSLQRVAYGFSKRGGCGGCNTGHHTGRF